MSFFGPLSCLSVMRRGHGLLGPLVRMKRQGVRHMGIFGEPTLVGGEDRVFHCREGKVRELLKKKMQITSGLLPKGGGDPRQSKSFGTLFV